MNGKTQGRNKLGQITQEVVIWRGSVAKASLTAILKIDHLRTIHAMFALNWLTGFRGQFFF